MCAGGRGILCLVSTEAEFCLICDVKSLRRNEQGLLEPSRTPVAQQDILTKRCYCLSVLPQTIVTVLLELLIGLDKERPSSD